jgi:cytochrome c oxidase subunit III
MNETAHIEQRDYTGAKLGMWFFLFTEILLFGGMFLVYSEYRQLNATAFHEAGKEMEVLIGAINTVILLTSSLTMALAISSIKRGLKTRSLVYQGATVLLGLAFLVNKYFEWKDHILKGFYPDSPKLLAMEHGKILFFGLYYVMTGIHALHVIIGMSVILFMFALTLRDKITKDDYVKLENTGLFWHIVDIIWIYLFPLFYLIL